VSVIALGFAGTVPIPPFRPPSGWGVAVTTLNYRKPHIDVFGLASITQSIAFLRGIPMPQVEL
jgi:hypothetical protein